MAKNRQRPSRLLAPALAALLLATACGGGGGGPPGGGDPPRLASVRGRLAFPAPGTPPAGRVAPCGAAACAAEGLSFQEVSVDLLRVDGNQPPETWPVERTAVPDAAGSFAFTEIPEGWYALRLHQPAFAAVRYGLDTTEFSLSAGQALSLVLPVVTTVVHGLSDVPNAGRIGGPDVAEAGLDPATGEVAIASGVGLGLFDPDRFTMDLLLSHTLFDREFGGATVVLFPPTPGLAWVLFQDRLVRVDRSVFADPDASEVLDLEDPAVRLAVGDRVRYRLWTAPDTFDRLSGVGGPASFFFSPDEGTVYTSNADLGVTAIHLDSARIEVTRPGWVVGHNPATNQLFVADTSPFYSQVATEVAVVDAATGAEVAVIPLGGVPDMPMHGIQGAAPVPGTTDTLLVGLAPDGGGAPVTHFKVVDATGAVVVDQRARDFLGLDHDPAPGFPSFDAAGRHLVLGQAAFRALGGGAWQEVRVTVPPGPVFESLFARCRHIPGVVDTTHLVQVQLGCDGVAGILSLDQANVPVAAFPAVDTSRALVDAPRGRIVFRGPDKLVVFHYADPSAVSREEWTDLSALAAPIVAPGPPCDGSTPCAAGEICAAAAAGATAGRCFPNPRLPYVPLCGGFEHAACDEGFACTPVHPSDPNSVGLCAGHPDRDYAAHGPWCGPGGACPAGTACGAADRCEPRGCLRDADCAAGEVCGIAGIVGRACVARGSLPDGAPCLGPEECQHGACKPISRERSMETGDAAWAVIHGHRGLMACTTPCFQQADCPSGSRCLYEGHQPVTSDVSAWTSHRWTPVPFCAPPELPGGCPTGCAASQLCDLSAIDGPSCRTGFSPWVITTLGGPACLPGAVKDGIDFMRPCKYACATAADCPWETTCDGGFCAGD